MDDAEITSRCEKEIVELHRFFTDWFRGAVPDTDEAWARVADVLAPELVMIAPSGQALPRETLLTGIRARHRSMGPELDFEIRIRRLACRPLSEEVVLATYEEWQRRDGEETGRLSTALFERDARAPHGVRWLHVHETWLPRTS